MELPGTARLLAILGILLRECLARGVVGFVFELALLSWTSCVQLGLECKDTILQSLIAWIAHLPGGAVSESGSALFLSLIHI